MSVKITFEGKAGLALSLIGLFGAGVVIVRPELYPFGWALIAVALVLGALLAAHQAWELYQDRSAPSGQRKMIAFIGMIACGGGLLAFGAWYFWPARPAPTVAETSSNGEGDGSVAVPASPTSVPAPAPAATPRPVPIAPLTSPQKLKPPALSRLISYHPEPLQMVGAADGAALVGYAFDLRNTSDEMVRPAVEAIRISVGDRTLFRQPRETLNIVARGEA